jgi:hypothetical protein
MKYSSERDRRPTTEVEAERAENGELTLRQRRIGVPNLNEVRRLPFIKDGQERYYCVLPDRRHICYRNIPRVPAPELYEEIETLGVITEIFQLTKAMWVVFFD